MDPQGVNVGGFGLRLRAQDMAKLGLLYLQDGVWQGQQVVPSDWISRATTEQADNGDGGYGYLWWVDQIDGDPAYTALGRGGQRIWVIPNPELVVVYQVWTDPAAGPQAVAGKIMTPSCHSSRRPTSPNLQGTGTTRGAAIRSGDQGVVARDECVSTPRPSPSD